LTFSIKRSVVVVLLGEAAVPLLKGGLLGERIRLKSPLLSECELFSGDRLLGGNTERNGKEAKDVGDNVLHGGELAGTEENGQNVELAAAVVNHGLLNDELNDENNDEPFSVEDTSEDVDVIRVRGSGIQ